MKEYLLAVAHTNYTNIYKHRKICPIFRLIFFPRKVLGIIYIEMLIDIASFVISKPHIITLSYSAPFTVVLTRRFSLRMVSLMGGVMVGCGYFLSGFVTRMELMYVTFTITGMLDA